MNYKNKPLSQRIAEDKERNRLYDTERQYLNKLGIYLTKLYNKQLNK